MSVRNSPKIQKLVVNAIRKLQDVEGSSPREISNYISQEYDVPTTKIQRQVRLALARAVSYGILQRSKGGYYACNRDFIGCQPQMEEGQPAEKCGCSGRGHGVKRARSRKSRRRKCATGTKRRSMRRGGGRSSRRRSRRGKSGCRRRGSSGDGKKSRRRGRRRGHCGGASKKSRRRRRRRRARSHRSLHGRSGKKCEPSSGGDGGGGGGGAVRNNDKLELFAGRGRARSASASRHENRSVSSGSFEEEEQLDRKHDEAQVIDSPETLLD